MATVQNVLDSTIVRFMDPDKTQYADTELLAYCQKAVDYVNQLLIMRNDITATKSGTVTLLDGTETYLLSANSMTDFIAMYEGNKLDETGVWIDDKFLTPCRITERVGYTTTSETEPEKYYVTSTSIGVLPVPDTTYTLSCLYFYKAATLTVTSDMPFNDIFNEAVSAFITSMASSRVEQDISNITQLYNELEAQALGVTSRRTPIRPKMRVRTR